MQNIKKVFSRFGFAQLAGMAAIMLLSLALTPFVNQESLEKLISSVGPSVLLLMTYAPNFLFLLVFWLIIRKVPKVEWRKESMSFGMILKIFVMMYALSSVLNQIGTVISRAAPAGGTEQLDLIDATVNTKLLIGFLIPAVIGPVVEELIFRKFMIDRLHNYGETAVIVFTALCFGLYHGNLTQFLYASCVGLFLGYVYCKTGKVIYTMIMHMLLNTFSASIMLLVPMLQGDGENVKALLFVAVGVMGVAMLAMGISGFILIIRTLKKKDMVLDDSMTDAIPKEEVLKTVYLNPGVAALFLVSASGIMMDLLNLRLPFYGRSVE